MKRILILAAAALTVAACTAQHPGAAPSPRAVPAAHCGLDRWSVKTGTDPGAAAIGLGTVQDTTIAALTAIPPPAALPPATRIPPVETTVWRVTGTLTGYKTEADSDIHLILSDGTHTMIAEIPDPACVGAGSPFLPGITAARAAFTARYQPGPSFQPASAQVTVTGVGFFDYLHGQTGAAPNGAEIHPVLSVQFG